MFTQIFKKICLANHYISVMIAQTYRLTSAEVSAVAEVERPQSGGAGCGHTSLEEALMSSM
jgi:hypothetical protein